MAVLVDYDADGMPDDWEVAYFGSIGARPGDDQGGDGFTNLQEHWADTDPTRASSRPCVDEIRCPGGNVTIRFVLVLGRKCRIESSDDLKDWNRIVQDNVIGTGGLIEVTDPGGGGATRRFYRVVVTCYPE